MMVKWLITHSVNTSSQKLDSLLIEWNSDFTIAATKYQVHSTMSQMDTNGDIKQFLLMWNDSLKF